MPIFCLTKKNANFALSNRTMSRPLAERLRPQSIEEYIGQTHLVGANGVFRKFLDTGNVPSFILSVILSLFSFMYSAISSTVTPSTPATPLF